MGRDHTREVESENLGEYSARGRRAHLPDLLYAPGERFLHPVAPTAFYDGNPAMLVMRARCDDGHRLPHWIRFSVRLQAFRRQACRCTSTITELRITVIASNLDGLEARNTFVARRVTRDVTPPRGSG